METKCPYLESKEPGQSQEFSALPRNSELGVKNGLLKSFGLRSYNLKTDLTYQADISFK